MAAPPHRLRSARPDRTLRWIADRGVSVRAYELHASDTGFCVSTRSSELTFVLEGALEIEVGGSGRIVGARAGEGLVVLRGTPHRTRATPGTRLVIVDVAPLPSQLPGDGLGAAALAPRLLPVAMERLVPALWDQRAIVDAGALASTAEAVVGGGIREALVPLETTTLTGARMHDVKRHIETHFREPLDLERIATRFRMSRFYLAKGYRRAFGIAPMAYAQALRLEAFVWSLLDRRGRSLGSLAVDAGVGDYATFCRRVRERFGRAPSELVVS